MPSLPVSLNGDDGRINRVDFGNRKEHPPGDWETEDVAKVVAFLCGEGAEYIPAR